MSRILVTILNVLASTSGLARPILNCFFTVVVGPAVVVVAVVVVAVVKVLKRRSAFTPRSLNRFLLNLGAIVIDIAAVMKVLKDGLHSKSL